MGAPFFLPEFWLPFIDFECKLFLYQCNPPFGSCSLPLVPATSFCVLFLSSNVLLFIWHRYHIGTTDLSCADNITLLWHFARAYWKRASYRLTWAMRLAGLGLAWERAWDKHGTIMGQWKEEFLSSSGTLGTFGAAFCNSILRVRARGAIKICSPSPVVR